MRLGPVTLVVLVLLGLATSLRDVKELWRLPDARQGNPCQGVNGGSNWGVFEDSYALQTVLWSQAGPVLSEWTLPVQQTTAHGGYCPTQPTAAGTFVTAPPTCDLLNTAHSRDLFRSTNVPTDCNCTRTAFDLCVYQIQVTDVRCGTPYKIWFTQSPDYPIGQRLGDGQQISGPGRTAIDTDVSSGGSTADACSPLANAAALSGHWCVVQRGGCSFETKVLNCLGGTTNVNLVLGVLVVDNTVDAPNGVPSSAPPTFSFELPVPVLMITYEEGARLTGYISSTIFTVAKTIGPAYYAALQSAGVLTREHRTGQVFGAVPSGVNSSCAGSDISAYRFFWEPNRLLGWAFGYQAADGTIDNVALFDTSDTSQQPQLLAQWTFASIAGVPYLNWSGSQLVFGQQSLGNQPTFFWILGNDTSYMFWNVTGAPTNVSLVPGVAIPKQGNIFIDRAASTLWQQIPSPVDGQVHQWRYQEAWDIRNIGDPRVLGSFALDTSFLTFTALPHGVTTMDYPTFDIWGSDLVSFNLADDGIAFYNYSNPIQPSLSAWRDTSPSSCAPVGVGGPAGPIMPTSQRDVWVACQQFEPAPVWQCGAGAARPQLVPCEPSALTARVDFVGYKVLPDVYVSDKCEDGAIVNMFWQLNQQPSAA